MGVNPIYILDLLIRVFVSFVLVSPLALADETMPNPFNIQRPWNIQRAWNGEWRLRLTGKLTEVRYRSSYQSGINDGKTDTSVYAIQPGFSADLEYWFKTSVKKQTTTQGILISGEYIEFNTQDRTTSVLQARTIRYGHARIAYIRRLFGISGLMHSEVVAFAGPHLSLLPDVYGNGVFGTYAAPWIRPIDLNVGARWRAQLKKKWTLEINGYWNVPILMLGGSELYRSGSRSYGALIQLDKRFRFIINMGLSLGVDLNRNRINYAPPQGASRSVDINTMSVLGSFLISF